MVSKMTAMLHVQTDRCEKLQAKMEEVQEVAKVREQEYLSLKKSYYDLQDMLRMQERQLDERVFKLVARTTFSSGRALVRGNAHAVQRLSTSWRSGRASTHVQQVF